mmetsp:Transcript_14321/g.31348  ORF Transcript_14321/g.31348 Transcript_14321/m.31348 type:complete len:81 (+) Transcript_14321:302-544(+)
MERFDSLFFYYCDKGTDPILETDWKSNKVFLRDYLSNHTFFNQRVRGDWADLPLHPSPCNNFIILAAPEDPKASPGCANG